MLSSLPLVLNQDPVYLLLHVTGKCNAACSHCFYWEEIEAGKNEPDLGFEHYEKLSQSLNRVLIINLCGAEAYLRPDLPKLVQLFARQNQCRFFTIPSNGYVAERILSHIEQMCEENPNVFFRFAFSLDGPKENHDKIRQVPGLFDQCCETIQQVARLKEKYSNFVLITSTVFSSETENHILEFLDWIKLNLPVEQTNVTFVRGNPMLRETLDVNPKIYDAVLDKVKHDARLKPEDRGWKSALPYAMFLNTMDTVREARDNPGERVFECYSGTKLLVIGRKGEVFPCEILDDSHCMGNLRDYNWNLKALLQSKRAREVVNWISQKRCACTWECAIQSSKAFDPKQWWGLGKKAVALMNENVGSGV